MLGINVPTRNDGARHGTPAQNPGTTSIIPHHNITGTASAWSVEHGVYAINIIASGCRIKMEDLVDLTALYV